MYSTLSNIKNSLKLSWKFKILWVFAILISSAGMNFGGGGGSSSDNNNDSQEEGRPYNSDQMQFLEDEIQENLVPQTQETPSLKSFVSEVTSSNVDDFNILSITGSSELIANNAALISFSFLSVIFLLTLVKILISSWARGSFLTGTHQVLSGVQTLDKKELSDSGLQLFGKYFKLTFVLGALVVIPLLLIGIVSIPMFVVPSLGIKIAFGVIFLLLLISYAVWMFSLTLATPFIFRLISFENKSCKESISEGLSILKKNFGYVFKLEIGWMLVMFGYMAVVMSVVLILALPIFLLITPVIALLQSGDSSLILVVTTLGVMIGLTLGLAFGIAAAASGAMVLTAKEISYTELYMYIKSKKEDSHE